jgi:hypothetical protein
MPLILSGNVSSALGTGYDVANSCMFNKGDTAYMHKTLSAGNRRTWTFSTWFKRISLGTQVTFGVVQTSTGDDNIMAMQIRADNKLEVWDYAGGITAAIVTNRLFRDTGAWYHVCVAADTTSGTANNRLRLYINGTEERSVGGYATDTMPSENYDFNINQNTKVLKFGAYDGGSVGSPADFYFAETVFIDGTQYAASDFGEFNEDSPQIWQPKAVSGLTFGTNGFYLDYEDSSNLGNDANGGTDLTEVNLAATDQTSDTCTNNFATFNPLINNWTSISQGNLKVTNTSQAYRDVFSTVALTSGKWYVECRIDTEIGGTYPIFGIADASEYQYPAQYNLLGRSPLGWGFQTDGNYYNNNADAGNWSTLDSGDIIGFYLDLDSSQNTLKVYKNGSSELSLNISDPVDGYYFGCSTYQEDSVSGSINFGNPSFSISSGNSDANGYGNFEYSPTLSGVNYYAICTKNLGEFGG